jgi:hypothetical protein
VDGSELARLFFTLAGWSVQSVEYWSQVERVSRGPSTMLSPAPSQTSTRNAKWVFVFTAPLESAREFACAAIIDLVTRSAIRAGNESYTRLRGTRGAVTLLKSNVTVRGKVIMLRFRSKGGKTITKEISAPLLAKAVRALLQLPGRRLFQCRSESGAIRALTARLQETANHHPPWLQGTKCSQRGKR